MQGNKVSRAGAIPAAPHSLLLARLLRQVRQRCLDARPVGHPVIGAPASSGRLAALLEQAIGHEDAEAGNVHTRSRKTLFSCHPLHLLDDIAAGEFTAEGLGSLRLSAGRLQHGNPVRLLEREAANRLSRITHTTQGTRINPL